MSNQDKLSAASEEITDHMESSAFYDIGHRDELMISTAKKYEVSPKDLSEYHNAFGHTAERLREQVADDMGVPYSAVWRD